MSEENKGAKESESLNDKEGAKKGISPTPEELKAAQDAAEKFRKEAESKQEELEAKKAELEELEEKVKLTEAEKKRKTLLEAGISDDEVLIADLEAEAQKGVRWVKAVNAQIKKMANEIAAEIVDKKLTEREFNRELIERDDWIEERAAERKEDVKELMAKLEKAAAQHQDVKAYPMLQAKKAYKTLLEVEKFQKEKAEFEEAKKKEGNFRDGGTDHKGGEKSGKKDWSQPGSWREAKTQREKEEALSTI